jgi:hypothetical protein
MTTATEFEGSVIVHLEYSDGPVHLPRWNSARSYRCQLVRLSGPVLTGPAQETRRGARDEGEGKRRRQALGLC